MMYRNMLLLLVLWFYSGGYVHTQTYENMTSLKNMLFTGYDTTIIPLLNQSGTMDVNYVIKVSALPEVDTINSWIKLTMSINMRWRDEKLTWDPSLYEGIQQIMLPAESIWSPSFVLGSGPEYEYVTKPQNVLIQNTGVITMVTKQSFTSLCDFKMAHWPFDKHLCKFYFIQVDTEPGKIRLTADGANIQSEQFKQLGPWVYEDCITKINRNLNGQNEAIFYHLIFHRQAMFYMLTIIFPLICIAFLSLLVFMLPCDSGERINFSITIMLAMTVFLTIMKDEMPKTSHPLPIMCIFISALILAVFMTTIANAVCLIIYHRHDSIPITSTFLFLTNMVYRKTGGRRVTNGDNSSNHDNEKTGSNGKLPIEDIQSNQGDEIESSSIPEKKITWKLVTNAMDIIMFVMLLLVLIMSLFITFVCLVVDTESQYDE